MAVEIIMPKLGLTMKTGTIVNWLKGEGEQVAPKEPLLDIETEKLSYCVESPAGGVLIKQLAQEGEKYPVAAVLGYVGEQGEEVAHERGSRGAAVDEPARSGGATAPEPYAAQAAGEDRPAGRVFISPVAKKLAAALGVDYKQIKGTSTNGRIVKADVQRYAQAISAAQAQAPAWPDSMIPYSGIRRAVGEVMMKAWQTIPMVTHQVSAGAGALLEYRAMLNAGVEAKEERVTIGELLMKLTAAALREMPILNSSLTAQGIALHNCVNLGMATALEDGLIVPVIHDADKKGLLAVSREAKDLAARARSGELTPDDVSGATFTVSNLGSYGSVDFFTPIINPPQAAILGVGRVTDIAAAVDGVFVAKPVIGLSLTYDHRIVDGAKAAEFIAILMRLMDYPARALLGS